MKVDIITHETGDILPLLLDDEGLPIPVPNEFIISRRFLSPNTLIRNLRELSILYLWLKKEKIDLEHRILSELSFNEAEIKGGLIEYLRKDHEKRQKIKKLAVTPNTFNQRLTTVRQFFVWYIDIIIGSIPYSSDLYDQVLNNKNKLLRFFETSFIQASPVNHMKIKGLTIKEVDFVLAQLNPNNKNAYGRDNAVKYRNYIMVMIMLYYGLRPGELLSLRVEDIEIGAISSIKVQRRNPDPYDLRKPRPQIKRNGRILAIQDAMFAKNLDVYITEWREMLEDKSDKESNYLILNDEGEPLSLSSINQFFQILREKYPNDLPSHFTPKALRHTFSANMERNLRQAGMTEDRRKQTLSYLRGDSNLTSQEVYIAQEIHEQANNALRKYQQDLISEDLPW